MPRIVGFDPGGLKIAAHIVPHLPDGRIDLRLDPPLSSIGLRRRCGAKGAVLVGAGRALSL